MEPHALGLHLPHPAVDVALLHLEVGNAVAQQAAGLRLALEDVDVVADPGELLGGGEAAGPEPMIATCLPVFASGGSGTTQPIAQALSAIACSMVLIATGWFSEVERARLLAGSRADAAGEFGKLLVEWRLRDASSQSALKTRSFQSGIWLWTGQPVGPWQNGMPQSMQRAACFFSRARPAAG